ncbi:MAG: FAD-dependent oxidoreductase [Acidimicrobiales bacterium]
MTATDTGGRLLIEAEEFAHYGGWQLDSQFEIQMGSPYLLAHGYGRPVEDAVTTGALTQPGTYTVWVRAKDWVPSHSPGRFQVSVDGARLATELGVNGQDWVWQEAGSVDLVAGEIELRLHDMTGFDGRCDAIYLSSDGSTPVDGAGEEAIAWRRQLRGLPAEPVDGGEFDVVVVGGGIAGCAATLTAARLGSRVAVIQDRPFLGGNASKEIGLHPRGESGDLIRELADRTVDGDLSAQAVLGAEPNVTLLLENRVYAVATDGRRVSSVDARATRTGVETRFRAPVFIDCTGSAILGQLAGAEILQGQEAKDEYDESRAPDERDGMHHGNTLFFRTRIGEQPSSFPDVPWATEVSKDYANLSGQLLQPGVENAPGPKPGQPAGVDPVFDFSDAAPGVNPAMAYPATHFWEYGQWLDLQRDAEHIRDHLLRALYGTFSNVKRLDPEHYANLEIDWIAHVAAQGEFVRYRGEHVLTENDVRNHTEFHDAVVRNDGAFCLHYPPQPGESDYDFRLKDWVWDAHDAPYAIPFRSLMSVSFDNLMMAGKHISVTHIAGSSVKLMGNGGQHGAAVGIAAHLCAEHGTDPRGIYNDHLGQLQQLASEMTGCGHLHLPEPPPTVEVVVERHAQNVLDGDHASASSDFYGNALVVFTDNGGVLPNGATGYEIVHDQPGFARREFTIRYDTPGGPVDIHTCWHLLVGQWRLTEASMSHDTRHADREPMATPTAARRNGHLNRLSLRSSQPTRSDASPRWGEVEHVEVRDDFGNQLHPEQRDGTHTSSEQSVRDSRQHLSGGPLQRGPDRCDRAPSVDGRLDARAVTDHVATERCVHRNRTSPVP